MQSSLIKVGVSYNGAEMTEDDRTWNTRLTKTARKTKEQKKTLTLACGGQF